MDQLNNETHENWYSMNIDATTVHVHVIYPIPKYMQFSIRDSFVHLLINKPNFKFSSNLILNFKMNIDLQETVMINTC